MGTTLKYRKSILCITAIIIFSILFPYIVTCAKIRSDTGRIYTPKPSGRTIVLDGSVKLDMEEFIPCVLYAMLPYEYEEEALKAQIVIIRTYIMLKMGQNNEIGGSELGLPYTTYADLEKEWGRDYEKLYNYKNKLISNTEMQVIKYEGQLIYPYYHEISEGVTCEGDQPYLKPVESSADISADNYLGITYFTKEEVITKLKDACGVELKPEELISKIIVNKYENSNYVKTVSVGEAVISGEDFMKTFSLVSGSYTVEEFAEGIKMVSKGIGSGKGLSLFGAKKMAEQGSSYMDIIGHYYSGAEVVSDKP